MRYALLPLLLFLAAAIPGRVESASARVLMSVTVVRPVTVNTDNVARIAATADEGAPSQVVNASGVRLPVRVEFLEDARDSADGVIRVTVLVDG